MPSGVVVTVPRKLRDIERVADVANLAALQRVAPQFLEAIKAATPRSSNKDQTSKGPSDVHLADVIYIDNVTFYGRNRYQVAVRVPANQKSKFMGIVRGRPAMTIHPVNGEALAFYWPGVDNPRSKDGRVIFKNVDLTAIPANNFPKRAVRANAYRLTHLVARQIIVSVNQA